MLLNARSAVNRSSKPCADKKIGSSLGAKVTIDVAGHNAAASLLKRYREFLPMLFIVSEVALGPVASAAADLSDAELRSALEQSSHLHWTADWDFAVQAAPSDGVRCARCWRYVASVSSEPAWAGLCERCQGALAEAVHP